jgi:hypothetical protein
MSVVLLVTRRRPFPIADRFESKMHSQLISYVLIDGAGVRHLFSDAHVGQKFQNQVRLYLQLSRKHVDTDLLHKQTKCERGNS